MSLTQVLRGFQNLISIRIKSQQTLRPIVRYVYDKHHKKTDANETKDEKDLMKTRITLKDQTGNYLGTKTLSESKLLAQKLNLNLIEDKEDLNHYKYKPYKLVSNKYLAQIEEDFEDSPVESADNQTDVLKAKTSSVDNKTVVKEIKHLVFSTKLNEHDLMTKINQIKRWLLRGHQCVVNVTNPKNDRQLLEDIYLKFDTQLKSVAKLNQKKIKSNNTLKFVVSPNIDSKDQINNRTATGETIDDLDIENMDPNKLLSDEFEKELNK